MNGPRLPALVFLLCCCAWASGSLLAIDLGSSNLKVSLVKAGRTPISIVINEMSKRKTPALVAFVKGERLLGEEAAALLGRHPQSVYARMRDLLGMPADHPSVKEMLDKHRLPYQLEADPQRGTVRVKTDNGTTYSVEEMVASVLVYAKQIGEAQAGGPVLDCVITVPAFFGPYQRQALLDSAKLAGLNVMAIVNNHAAAALQYGIERDFSNGTQNIILYDMGASSVQTSLVRFSTYPEKGGKSVNQLEVLDAAWDAGAGGDDLDALLIQHFGREFSEKHGLGDVLQQPRVVAKLRKQAKKTKEVLSANTHAPFNVEELHQDIDFSSTILRSTFEEMAGELLKRALQPLQRLLQRNGLQDSTDGVAGVILLGGSSRIPALRETLSAVLGGRSLDRNLDADEAVAMGAGLIAANHSATFRLRKFGVADSAMYPLKVQLVAPADVHLPADSQDTVYQERQLLPVMKHVPCKRVVKVDELERDPVELRAFFPPAVDGGEGLPPGVQTPELARWKVTGLSRTLERYNSTGKVSFHFAVDASGMLSFPSADALVDLTDLTEEEADQAATEPATDGNATEAAAPTADEAAAEEPSGGGEAEAPAPAPPPAGSADGEKKEDTSQKPKRRRYNLRRSALKIEQLSSAFPGLTEEQMAKSQDVLRRHRQADITKAETAAAKNKLESYIISTRDDLDTVLKEVTTEVMRSNFHDKLTEYEDWLYMDGEEASAQEFEELFEQLNEIGSPMFKRAAEKAERPQAVEAVTSFIGISQKIANSWPEVKPWLNETERADVQKQLDELSLWLQDVTAQQDSRPDHEEPVFTVNELKQRFRAVNKAVTKLNDKPKPKPKPDPAAANATASNSTSAGASEKSAEEKGGTGSPPSDGKHPEKHNSDADAHDELRR